MKERVDEAEWIEFQWPYLMTFLGGADQVRKKAYETGAFARARKVETPEALLQLLLIWAAGGHSLMETAALAADSGLADVSDVALLRRFEKCGDWLGDLLGQVLTGGQQCSPSPAQVRLIDATTISRPGKKGIDHRIHLGMDLRTNRIDSVELTGVKQGETLTRFSFRAGEINIGDAGYGQRAGLAKVARAEAFFIVRFAWSNLPLETRDGKPFALLEALETLPEASPGEFPVRFRAADGEYFEARLVAIRKSEAAATEGRRKTLAERTKHGSIDARTLQAAGFFFVLTNLPPTYSAESVLQMYRFRWQIEMKFKTLKSVLHLGDIPVRGEQMLRVYVLAKLLIAVLIDSLIYLADSFSPWGYRLSAIQPVETDSVAS
jgi:hypothetical protein